MTKANDVNFLDLDSLDTISACDKGAEIELQHPVTKDPIGIFITILGKDSTVFREHIKDRVDSRIRQEALAERRGKPLPTPNSAQAELEATDLLTLCTVGWRQASKDENGNVVSKDTITHKKEELAFTTPNVKRLYQSLPWVRQQVDKAIGDMENFMPGSARI